MHRSTLAIALCLLCASLVATLSGCRNGQENVAPENRSSGDESLAALAVKDLAGRLNISAKEISVLREVNVTWRDGSLGCPREGMMYTQALVEGSLIVLRAGNDQYQYHSGKGRPPFYCENPVKPISKSSAE
ncbi:MAG: hypothetical protein KJO92_11315 [Gammaproteobacteria bacterium]|nr:hypothetical protein [Gammaproteobacteria bacterium]